MKNRSRNPRSRPGHRSGAPRRDPLIGVEVDVKIVDIGARGDGLAETAAIGGKSVLVYVDGVLPGARNAATDTGPKLLPFRPAPRTTRPPNARIMTSAGGVRCSIFQTKIIAHGNVTARFRP